MFNKKIFKLSTVHHIFILIFIVISAYYLLLFSNKQGDVYVGSNHVWGDWPLHFTWASYFVYNSFPPKMHPLLYEYKPIYPWLTDAISAGLIKLGTPFYTSFTIPNIVFTFLLIVVLYHFYKKMFKSIKLSFLTIILLLTNGGIGFIYYLKTILRDPSYLLSPPHTYSQLSHLQLEFINFTSGLLVPQRAFLLGSLIGIFLIYKFYQLIFNKEKLNKVNSLIIFLSFLFLPLAHTHAYLSTVGIVLIWLFIYWLENKKRWRQSSLLLVPIILSGIFFIWFYTTNETVSYLKLVWGWYAGYHQQNIFIFWFKNWTLVPFISYAIYPILSKRKRLIYLPFLLLFIFANFVQIQPFLFDNTKLFFFAALGMYPLVIEFIKNIKNKYIILFIIMIISLTGTIEVYKMGTDLFNPKLLFTKEDIQKAKWVKENVSIDEIVEIENIHNHYIPCLTGRQVYQGYSGWLENYGFE